MWRSRLQVQCEHGTWRSPYGDWFGEPSDPIWFKPEMSDENFLSQAEAMGLTIQRHIDADSDFPGELNWCHGDAWFAMDLNLLEQVQFEDPKGQLAKIRHLFRDMARDLGYSHDQVRLVMYQTPKS